MEEIDIRKKLNLYAFRFIRKLITDDMIKAVLLDERQKRALAEQMESEILPKVMAIVDHAYEAGWNEGWDDCEADEERIEREVNEMFPSAGTR